jgi:hypothetical protein
MIQSPSHYNHIVKSSVMTFSNVQDFSFFRCMWVFLNAIQKHGFVSFVALFSVLVCFEVTVSLNGFC